MNSIGIGDTPLSSRNRLHYVPPSIPRPKKEDLTYDFSKQEERKPAFAADTMYTLLSTTYSLLIVAFFKSLIDKLASSRLGSRTASVATSRLGSRKPSLADTKTLWTAGEPQPEMEADASFATAIPEEVSTSSPKSYPRVLPDELSVIDSPPTAFNNHLYDSLFELDSSDEEVDSGTQYGTTLAISRDSDYIPAKYAAHLVMSSSTDDVNTTMAEVFPPSDEYDREISKFYLPFKAVPRQNYTITDAILSTIPSTSLTNFLKKERQRIQDLILKERQATRAAVPPLSSAQLDVVNKYWRSRQDSVNVVSAFSIDITVRDLFTLADGRWLNDNIIDFYLTLVSQKSDNVYCWTTHFFTTLKSKGYAGVARWAKRRKVNVTEKKLVIVPINIMSTHWAVAVVDNVAKVIKYHDSLSSSGNLSAVQLLAHYMEKECERLQVPAVEYDLLPNVKTPQQQNGYDCGVFTCTVSKHVAHGLPLSFGQNDMKNIRRRMAYEIIQTSLLDDAGLSPHL